MKITEDYQFIGRYTEAYKYLQGKILNIGCHHAIFDIVAKLKGFDITCLDVSPKYIKNAKENAKDSGVELEFIQASIEELPKDKKYDTIVLMDIIEHLPEPIEGLQEAIKLLNPKGKIIITTPCGFAHYSPDHLNFFFEEQHFKLLEELWTFYMMPKNTIENSNFILMKQLLDNTKLKYDYKVLDWKSSKFPSLDYFIVITNESINN